MILAFQIVSDPAKNAKNLYFTVVLLKIFLRTSLKHIRTFVWLVIFVMYGFTANVLGFQEEKNK